MWGGGLNVEGLFVEGLFVEGLNVEGLEETLSKGAILGVTKAHISRLECPTFFKLFTRMARRRIIGEILGQF